MEPLLKITGLTMDFGGIKALDHLDLRVRQGEIVALIGPNGAGKTAFFNCLTGIYKPTSGDLFLTPHNQETRRLNGLKPNKVTQQWRPIITFSSTVILGNSLIFWKVRASPCWVTLFGFSPFSRRVSWLCGVRNRSPEVGL